MNDTGGHLWGKAVGNCFLFVAVCVALCSCSTSHILVGEARTPTKPENIKVYLRPPSRYKEIAVVDSDSNGSFRVGAQAKINAALNRAKKDAAKLGANGLLLSGTGESGGVMVGSSTGTYTGNHFNSTGIGVAGGGLVKTISVVAIWVEEE